MRHIRDSPETGDPVQTTSGKPLTALAANPNPNYQNGGEIPLAPRGAGMQTSDRFMTRTPFTKTVNGQASYNLMLGGNRALVLLADVQYLQYPDAE